MEQVTLHCVTINRLHCLINLSRDVFRDAAALSIVQGKYASYGPGTPCEGYASALIQYPAEHRVQCTHCASGQTQYQGPVQLAGGSSANANAFALVSQN